MHGSHFIFLILLGLAGVAEVHAAKREVGKIERELAAFHHGRDPAALEIAWPHLDSPDRFIREAAHRVVMMDAGRVVEVGPPGQIFDTPTEERTRAFMSKIIRH